MAGSLCHHALKHRTSLATPLPAAVAVAVAEVVNSDTALKSRHSEAE